MSIYIWDKEVKEIYYGTKESFTPWANTILYFPFENDANDHSWNWYSLDVSGTQETIWRRFNTTVNFDRNTSVWNFISFWMKIYNRGLQWSWQNNLANKVGAWSTNGWLGYQTYAYYNGVWDIWIQFFYNPSNWNNYIYRVDLSDWNWHHIVECYSSTWWAWCFVDWGKHQLTTNTQCRTVTTNEFIINTTNTPLDVSLSDLLAETTARSDADVVAYFNATKSKYWVS